MTRKPGLVIFDRPHPRGDVLLTGYVEKWEDDVRMRVRLVESAFERVQRVAQQSLPRIVLHDGEADATYRVEMYSRSAAGDAEAVFVRERP